MTKEMRQLLLELCFLAFVLFLSISISCIMTVMLIDDVIYSVLIGTNLSGIQLGIHNKQCHFVDTVKPTVI